MDERIRRTKEIVLSELSGIIDKGGFNTDTLGHVYKLIDIYKDIQTIEAMEEYGETEYSEKGYKERPYYAGGNSRKREEMVKHLHKALEMADTEAERESIRMMINKL